MYATDYAQIYTLISGFYLNNKSLESMMLLGVHYIPIVYCIVKNMAAVKKAGEDEGDAGGLLIRYVLVDIIRIFLISLIFLIPFGAPLQVTPENVIKSNCEASTSLISNDIAWGSTVGKILFSDNEIQMQVENEIYNQPKAPDPEPDHDIYFEGVTAKAPIGLNIAHNGTVIFSSMVASSIPCGTDIRTITMKNAIAQLPDLNSSLQEGLGQFFAQCYQPNVRDVLSRTTGNTYNFESKLWPGADVFTSSSGLYNKNIHTYSIKQTTWHRIKQIEHGTEYPSISDKTNPSKADEYIMGCDDAYNTLTSGVLKERDAQLKADSSVISGIKNLYRNVSGWTQEKQDIKDLKVLFSELAFMPIDVHNDELFSSSGKDYGRLDGNGSTLVKAIGGLGLVPARLSAAAEAQLHRIMAPLLYSVTGMVIIMLFPVLTILSGYNAKVVFGLTAGVIVCSSSSLMLTTAEWIDSLLLPLISGSASITLSSSALISRASTEYVGSICYQWIPILWAILFGTIGAAVTPAAATSLSNAAKGIGAGGIKAVGGLHKAGKDAFKKPSK